MTQVALRGRCLRGSAAAFALLGTLLLGAVAPPSARAGEALARLEAAFREAGERARRATVLVAPRGVPRARAGLSSGVLVSPQGLVLSDGDAGLSWRPGTEQAERVRLDDVEIRLVEPGGAVRVFAGRVVARDLRDDTAVIHLLGTGGADLPWVPLGESDDLVPGAFLLAAGVAFDDTGEAPPTITAGILASADPRPTGQPGGRHDRLYGTAAINQGMNGGPVVGLDGRLVGTVSTWVEPAPDAPQQLLGKIVPLEVIRASALAGGEALPPPGRSRVGDVEDARALEEVVEDAARRARGAVVSLFVTRRRPIAPDLPTAREGEALPRWRGAVSGVLLDHDGWIVTSLYGLANVGELVFPLWRAPDAATVSSGLADVDMVEAWLPGGGRTQARVVGHDPRLGVVLLKVDAAAVRRAGSRPLDAASDLAPGRFVVTVGDPFGPDRRELPLVTLGILSRRHPESAAAPWRGTWQTDAPVLDTNAGGAAVDLDGRLVGMVQLWHPARHGRNSGVGFVVPVEHLRASALDIRTGRVPGRAFLGVRFAASDPPRLESVVADGPAARAGLLPGDVVLRMDGDDVATVEDAVGAVGFRYEGEVLEITVERGTAVVVVTVRLGRREP